ncbi:hypothetical protein Aca07nite_35050 [Actinoplanes capillaceus]|uniref:Uncharacterized protein n=1 Tax=Actinoplanes campanulatus TaxID=113559 RepID=A0ABQ3WJ32_9ACTN|nr:hypothetical protein Aca07nite_35050 [Actinoplanes capillaceus]
MLIMVCESLKRFTLKFFYALLGVRSYRLRGHTAVESNLDRLDVIGRQVPPVPSGLIDVWACLALCLSVGAL